MEEDDKKKYKHMENVLIKINEKFITLSDEEKKLNNKILDQVILKKVVEAMKQKDPMFKKMYERNFYGGSYYDGLKVGNPNEFDLDLILKLPVICEPKLSTTESPGFVKVQITEFEKLTQRPEGQLFNGKLNKLLDDKKFICTSKTLSWIEGILIKSLNDFPKDTQGPYVEVDLVNGAASTKIYMKIVKTGPAFTLQLNGTAMNKKIKFDIDLVPCFIFLETQWPNGYRPNPSSTRNSFLIVPKKPNDSTQKSSDIYWRLSFQEQERDLIKGNELKNMKMAIKFLKKLRDHNQHVKIASYYIKTVFLWEVEKQKNNTDFWKTPISCLFITMLKRYQSYLEQGNIPYYWFKNFNLIKHINPQTLTSISNCLKGMIAKIERNIEDPFVVCEYLLTEKNRKIIEEQTVLGKDALLKLEITRLSKTALDTPDAGTSGNITTKLLQTPSFLKLVKSEVKCLDKSFLSNINVSNNCQTDESAVICTDKPPASHNCSQNHIQTAESSFDNYSENADFTVHCHNCETVKKYTGNPFSKNSSDTDTLLLQLQQVNDNIAVLSKTVFDMHKQFEQKFDNLESRFDSLESAVNNLRKENVNRFDKKTGNPAEMLLDQRLLDLALSARVPDLLDLEDITI